MLWGIKAAGGVVRARGRGISAGQNILCYPHSGGLYAGSSTLGNIAQVVGSALAASIAEDVKLRQRKLGKLCCLATVSCPDICARLARIAPRINCLQGSDASRINDRVRTAKEGQKAAASKYASSTMGGGRALQRKDKRRDRE